MYISDRILFTSPLYGISDIPYFDVVDEKRRHYFFMRAPGAPDYILKTFHKAVLKDKGSNPFAIANSPGFKGKIVSMMSGEVADYLMSLHGRKTAVHQFIRRLANSL